MLLHGIYSFNSLVCEDMHCSLGLNECWQCCKREVQFMNVYRTVLWTHASHSSLIRQLQLIHQDMLQPTTHRHSIGMSAKLKQYSEQQRCRVALYVNQKTINMVLVLLGRSFTSNISLSCVVTMML